MAISGDYPAPVFVNGYACNNCAQVAEAKKGVDPADPKAGPYGVDAKITSPVGQSPAVIFGGVLAQGANGGVTSGQPAPGQQPPAWPAVASVPSGPSSSGLPKAPTPAGCLDLSV